MALNKIRIYVIHTYVFYFAMRSTLESCTKFHYIINPVPSFMLEFISMKWVFSAFPFLPRFSLSLFPFLRKSNFACASLTSAPIYLFAVVNMVKYCKRFTVIRMRGDGRVEENGHRAPEKKSWKRRNLSESTELANIKNSI